MEAERKMYAEESRTVITKQRGSVDQLHGEYLSLQDDLRMMKKQIEDDKRSGAGSKRAEDMRELSGTACGVFHLIM